VVFIVSAETQITCMYVCYAVVLVPDNPLCSYHGNLKSVWVCVCIYNTFIVVLVVAVETQIIRGLSRD
jgi:hypothetical protein